MRRWRRQYTFSENQIIANLHIWTINWHFCVETKKLTRLKCALFLYVLVLLAIQFSSMFEPHTNTHTVTVQYQTKYPPNKIINQMTHIRIIHIFMQKKTRTNLVCRICFGVHFFSSSSYDFSIWFLDLLISCTHAKSKNAKTTHTKHTH